MILNVLCNNCKEFILQTDPSKLSLPLKGDMFIYRKDREWNLFHPSDEDLALVCPMCSWTFHTNGELLVSFDGKTILGNPDAIREAFEVVTEPKPIDETVTDSTGIPKMAEPDKEKIIDQINEKINEATEIIREEVFNDPKPAPKKKAGRPFGSKTKNKKKKRKKRTKNKPALEKMGL